MTEPEYDLLTICKAYVEHNWDDAAAFIFEIRDGEAEEFTLPVETLAAFDAAEDPDESLEDWWRDEPKRVERHVVLALADEADADPDVPDDEGIVERISEDATFTPRGYTNADLYEVGGYPPGEVIGRTVHIRGQIVKCTDGKLQEKRTAFRCVGCEQITYVEQTGDSVDEPHTCGPCDKQMPFHVDEQATELRDYQKIRLQTLPEEVGGTETQTLDVRLYDDMIGTLTAGDRAIVTATVGSKRENPNSTIRKLYGDARSITKLTSDHTDIDVTPYEADIRAIADGPDPYGEVFPSTAPFHVGDDDIKEAIAYLIFAGMEKELPDGSWHRGNSHVLLMGDPGTGKSGIINYVARLVPRSEKSTGKRSSEAGLTAAAIKDEFSGGWTLQAGALVRANNGVAVIDELDKMDDGDKEGMLDAMSNQEISVSLAASGTLPAKCSVLAAANPQHGSFIPKQPIADQIDLDPTLLSRFDLKFMMYDEPDADRDEAVADSMTTNAKVGQKLRADEPLTAEDEAVTDPPIGPDMFRAYVALAKRHFPVLTDEAHARIVEEYVRLREVNADNDDAPIPTTARQLGALHRLSEASARIRLASDVLVDDVERAISILYASMQSIGIDPESGEYDARAFEGGQPTSQHEEVRTIKAILTDLTSDGPCEVSELREQATVVIDESTFDRRLEKLKRKGEVYEPSNEMIDLT